MSGTSNHTEALKRWYESGANPERWPKFQEDEDKASCLIVMTAQGVGAYGTQPYAIHEVGRAFTAWGSGRDFAIAAMACGKSAVEAVQLASQFDVNTGMGVDWFGVDGSAGHLE